MKRWESLEGSPIPLGVTWIEAEGSYNFAIYSKHAEKVTLVFFGDDLAKPIYRYEFEHLRNKTGPIWHCRIAQTLLAGAKFYAYQIDGPKPGPGFEWHTFDPEKLLLDPYARDVYFSPSFDREAARRPGSNWGRSPLSVLDSREPPFRWEQEPPLRHQSDLIIYEMHVRGFTHRENSGVAPDRRGTFAGVIDKIPYLQQLGVTAVELMPVFQFDPQEENYWGYMPLSFFAPHDAYCVDPESRHQHLEFCEMVQALHRSGIEVILDVVYNHTCEGDERGPTYSFKGIDSTTYYLLTGDPKAPFSNYSGTGKHAAHVQPSRAAIDPGQLAVLDQGPARRRVPLRFGQHLPAQHRRLDQHRRSRLVRANRRRSRFGGRAADRRAVGRGRRVPAGPSVPRLPLDAVERCVSGHPAEVRQERPRHGLGV